MGLSPNESFTSIKSKFPNARFVDVKAAWLKPDERLKQMSGEGIAGSIYLKMSTNETSDRELLASLRSEIANNPNVNDSTRRLAEVYATSLALPLDDRLTLDWLRWSAPSPVPMSRIQSKYGKADKCGFTEDSFIPFCEWTNKAIVAYGDEKMNYVTNLEFSFTQAEWNKAFGLPTKPGSKK